MEDTPDKGKITSWRLALDQEAEMVMEGQVVSRETAASVFDKPELMYGF